MQEAALWGQQDFPNGDLLLGGPLDLGGQPPGPGFAPFAADAAAAAVLQAGGPGGAPAAAAAGLFNQHLGAGGPRQDILIPPPMVPAASLGGTGSGGSGGGSSGALDGSEPLGAAPTKPLSKKELARQKNREKQARFRARQKVGGLVRCTAHGLRLWGRAAVEQQHPRRCWKRSDPLPFSHACVACPAPTRA